MGQPQVAHPIRPPATVSRTPRSANQLAGEAARNLADERSGTMLSPIGEGLAKLMRAMDREKAARLRSLLRNRLELRKRQSDSTSAVLRWRARSDTVGTPRGRFSVFPGLGIYT